VYKAALDSAVEGVMEIKVMEHESDLILRVPRYSERPSIYTITMHSDMFEYIL
jgi:hypothetical protein